MSSETSHRLLLQAPPFRTLFGTEEWNRRGEWPAQWVACADVIASPVVAAYKLAFELHEATRLIFHVTADERYRLFLNGKQIGEGSERGDATHWFFESYEVEMSRGLNTIVAQVWSLGDKSSFAQMSLGHGFLFCPDHPDWVETFATGRADWKAKPLPGYRFHHPQVAWGTGYNLTVDGGGFAWDFENGEGEGWHRVEVLDTAVGPEGENDKSPRRLLVPGTLPPMSHHDWTRARVRHISFPAPGPTGPLPFRGEDHLEEETIDWTRVTVGHEITISPYSRRRVLLDLHDYVCAYPEIRVSKGRQSSIRIHWQEALFDGFRSPNKGNRDDIDGKFFCNVWTGDDGVGDTFLPNGSPQRTFTTLWWQAGRYVELLIQTELEELVIESLRFREDRYPLENRLEMKCSDSELEQVGRLAFRTLQMCAHETYMDCPFYEQLQYIGDTRLQALVTYLTTDDDRLPRKALQMFDWSRKVEGVTQSRYPSRVKQIIPPFSLWWICMIWDFALWRGDREFVLGLMPGARHVLDWFAGFVNSDGVLEAPTGWNFADWVPSWHAGVPPDGATGVTCVLNRQYEIALRKMAELELWIDEPELASRDLRLASELAASIHRAFWNNKRGIYADDLGHSSFSEHAQALSILTAALPEKIETMVVRGLLTEPSLHRATVYFSHYLFEAFCQIGRQDQILSRLGLWTDQIALGLKTLVEMPEPTRSDCHAWSAHPLYHLVASVVGVRPAGLGGDRWVVRPGIGDLDYISASVPVRGSELRVALTRTEEGLVIETSLPSSVSGSVLWRGQNTVLRPGAPQSLRLGS